MRSTVISVATIATLALGASTAVAAPHAGGAAKGPQFRFTSISVNVNGSLCHHVQMAGINDNGTTVGTVFCGSSRGFVRAANGSTTKFRVPGPTALQTQTSGISSNGVISLYAFTKKALSYQSYLRSPNGTLTAIANPLAGPSGTRVLAVNASREAVGVYYTNTKKSVLAPFVMTNGTVRAFKLGIAGATNVILTGVTDRGVLSGQFSDKAKTVHGFLFIGGEAHVITVPGAPVASKRGSGVTFVAKGEILTGDIYSKFAVTGFVGRIGSFSPVAVPDSISTFCQGVNTHKEVVGFFLTKTDAVHGFIAKAE